MLIDQEGVTARMSRRFLSPKDEGNLLCKFYLPPQSCALSNHLSMIDCLTNAVLSVSLRHDLFLGCLCL